MQVTAAAGSLEGNLGKEAHSLRRGLHLLDIGLMLLRRTFCKLTNMTVLQTHGLVELLGSACTLSGLCNNFVFCCDIINAGQALCALHILPPLCT